MFENLHLVFKLTRAIDNDYRIKKPEPHFMISTGASLWLYPVYFVKQL